MLDHLGGHGRVEASTTFQVQQLRRVPIEATLVEMNARVRCPRNGDSCLIGVHADGVKSGSAQLRAQLPVAATEIDNAVNSQGAENCQYRRRYVAARPGSLRGGPAIIANHWIGQFIDDTSRSSTSLILLNVREGHVDQAAGRAAEAPASSRVFSTIMYS